MDDNLGRSALLEACYHGHDAIIDALKLAGASLTPASFSSTSGVTGGGSSGGSNGVRISMSGSSRSNISGSSGSSKRLPPQVDYAAAGGFGSMSGGLTGQAGDDGPAAAAAAAGALDVAGASWVLQLASLLCNCVYECNLPVGDDSRV